jgi:hypothetical protein
MREIRTMSVVVGSAACDAKCPYCISKMTGIKDHQHCSNIHGRAQCFCQKENKMRWIKYKQHWSHSVDKRWTYIEVPEDYKFTEAGEFLNDTGRLSNFSDKWRKVVWRRVYKLPKAILDKELEYAEDGVKYAQEKVAALKKMQKKSPCKKVE